MNVPCTRTILPIPASNSNFDTNETYKGHGVDRKLMHNPTGSAWNKYNTV